MKSTIKDVAKLAGVSFKTVSRVINKEGSVKPDTLAKVEAAIAQLEYQPNTAARSLAGTRSFAIGFIYNNPNAYYVIDMQRGILDECQRNGYELLIHPCDASASLALAEIDAMVKRSQLSGLVICPPLSEDKQAMVTLASLGIPFIRVVSGSDESCETSPCVFVHDREAAFAITRSLIDMGHTAIGFICGERDHNSTLERLAGYTQAMQTCGLSIDPEWIVDGRYAFDAGVNAAQQLLNGQHPPTAIFGCNDEIAAGALFGARLCGVDVPTQLSIAGFEDSPFSRQTLPPLTTAAQPTREIARQAASSLIRYLQHSRQKSAQHAIEHQHFHPTPVMRSSTQPRTRDAS